jgi:hypothetical protein
VFGHQFAKACEMGKVKRKRGGNIGLPIKSIPSNNA